MIKGLNKILAKSENVNFLGKEYTICEMEMEDYVKFLNGDFDILDNVDNFNNIVEMLLKSVKGFVFDADDEGLSDTINFLFNAVILLQTEKKDVQASSKYEYEIDYSYLFSKVMSRTSYKLDELLRLKYSQFMMLYKNISVLEAEEDLRMSLIVNNHLKLNSEKLKSKFQDLDKSFLKKISTAIHVKTTDEENLKTVERTFNQLKSLLKSAGGGK